MFIEFVTVLFIVRLVAGPNVLIQVFLVTSHMPALLIEFIMTKIYHRIDSCAFIY